MSEIKIQSKEITLVNPKELIPYKKNANKHTPEQIERLIKLIQFQGFRDPLIVQEGTNIVVAGHGRLQSALKIGMSEVPVTYQGFKDEDQMYSFMVSHNAISSWAELDLSAINSELENIGPMDIDLLGIKDFVIEPIEKFDPQCDEDEVPEVVDPITKRGDIWLLGEHRVMCGDSTMIDDVEKLINKSNIKMVYTDPPYGINEQGNRLSRGGEYDGQFYKDFKDDSIQYAIDAYNLCESLKIPRQVWWGANYYCHSLPQGNNWFVWDKREDDKNKDNNSDCELAWVKSEFSSVRIFRHRWKGMIKASEHGQKRVHPTQKPIALAEWAFNYFKDKTESIMDLFLGSGSTLIACEKTNRKCYGMELDEHYCDVIINRWQNFTGKEATLESTGETYNSLKDASCGDK